MTFGLNDDAFTLSLFAVVGDIGPAPEPDPLEPVWPLKDEGTAGGTAGDARREATAAGGVDPPPALVRLPLNAGIGWMNMAIRPFALALPLASFPTPDPIEDEEADVDPLDPFGTGVPLFPIAAAAAAAFPPAPLAILLTLKLVCGTPAPPPVPEAAAATEDETPMERAWLD